MSRVEQIVHQIHLLPEPLQEEVLDFIEFLQKKHHVKDNVDDDESLLAMKGGLEHSTTFAADEVEIQEQLRDEWN